MVLTGPFYWDGTNFPVNTDVTDPTLITQAQFEACCCPCENCSGAQNDIVITGDGTGACDYAGTYSPFVVPFIDSTNYCMWLFSVGLGTLVLIYCKLSKTYCSAVTNTNIDTNSYGRDADSCTDGCEVDELSLIKHTDIGNPLTCVAGQITGHYSLQGDDVSGVGGDDCSAFSISVSFNGG